MCEIIQDSVWRLYVPPGRQLSDEAFQELVDQFLELRQQLIFRHALFAHLIKIEQVKKGVCQIGFFDSSHELPTKMVIFTDRKCIIFDSQQGIERVIDNFDEGVICLVNLIRLTSAQQVVFSHDTDVAIFLSSLQVRIGRLPSSHSSTTSDYCSPGV